MGCCGWRASDRNLTAVTESPVRDDAALRRHLSCAEADLAAGSDGTSLCRIDEGPQAGSAKHAEGRWAALREVDRHLRRPPGATVLATAGQVLELWEAAQCDAVTKGSAWAAYRDGGVAELRSLIDDLAASANGAS